MEKLKILLLKIIFSFCLVINFQTTCIKAQGFKIQNGKQKGELPFEYVNGFIVVSVLYNHVFPLKFIFDTGASNTIIHNKDIVNLFDPDYARTFTVYGADLNQPMYAHLVRGVHLETDELKADKQNILVLEDDYFSFKQLTGMEIHGIIGADMFRNHKIRINYQKGTIQFYIPSSTKLNTKGSEKIKMALQKSKPYIICPTTLSNQTQLPLKLLVDTGASAALLLDIDSDTSLVLPDNIVPENLGFGIGGEMKGYVGRIPYIEIAGKSLESVVCHFQEASDITNDSLSLIFRHGLLGNYILDRFELTIDYPGRYIYLKPTRKWRRKFVYDKSGIGFIAVGLEKTTYYIQSVLEDSPADLAGVKAGDIIQKVNYLPSVLLSYDNINKVFKGKTGEKVKIKVKRGEEIIKFEFLLKDLI